jgi:predicted O-methyltransferase YrrM
MKAKYYILTICCLENGGSNMKTTKISELPIVPEHYAVENHMKISDMDLDILMTKNERLFINGLIQFYEPQNIIEIGIHRGGGSVNILNAATRTANIVSIDKMTEFVFKNRIFRIGEILTENYPDFKQDNWHLITGKDPSEVMEELNMKFDFAVIDSGHFHPCETLNFISIFPYLNNGAIVVMHDIINYMYANEQQYAPRLLMSSVCAEKITTIPCEGRKFPNIVAFQVTQDTRKYIQNVFDILLFPWQYFNKKDVANVYNLVKKHYMPKQISTFEEGVDINLILENEIMCLFGYSDIVVIQNIFNELDKDTVFYGAGNRCLVMLNSFIKINAVFEFRIWDQNALYIKTVFDKHVTLPDFETLARPGQIMVITIENIEIANTVRNYFESLGYTVYHGVKQLIQKWVAK